MHRLAVIPAFIFLALTGWVNVLFAGVAGTDATTKAMWLMLGIACATFTALGPFLAVEQFKRRLYGRCAAAVVMLCGCLAYDVIAGRAVHGYLHAEHVKAYETDARAYATLQTRAEEAKRDLLAFEGTPPLLEAQGALEALRLTVSDDQCREVTGPNRLSAVAAGRIRSMCEDVRKARQTVARAEARIAAAEAAKAAQRDADAATAPLKRDARSAVVGEAVALWLPVLLVTGGALLSGFAATISPERETRKTQLQNVETVKENAAPKPEEDKTPISRLQSLLLQPSTAPKGVTVDAANRRIKGTQRPLAKFAGVPLSRLNNELQNAAQLGRVQLDTSDGTTITFN